MYKKVLGCLAAIPLLFFSVFTEPGNMAEEKEYAAGTSAAVLEKRKINVMGIVPVAASGQRIVYWERLERPLQYQLDQREQEILCRIVEAEAGGEDPEGRLLVANVVLNRVDSDIFPDSVSEVVFQKEQGVAQFSPVSDGRYEKATVSRETMDAVRRALEGEDNSGGALYFAAREKADSERMRWFDENLTFLFRHGRHEFFK